jgi:tetratricopeptide (TPR) repeat protein
MKSRRISTVIAAGVLALAFTGALLALNQVDRVRGRQSTLEDVLYIPSSKTLKKMSLGYNSLLADVYWTRAVQYFGSKHQQEDLRYDLLYPLLDITTDLDPHLIIAYEFGSVFLSQPAPTGGGAPDKAVALVEKGIRANPDHWRLYFTLGYIHYFDRKDYKAAQQAFQTGSEKPGAYFWMKVMAAEMAQHAGETGFAAEIWKRLLDSGESEMVKDNARQHLAALRLEQAIDELNKRIEIYRQKEGRLPSTWTDMGRVGLLRGVPIEILHELKLMPDGTIQAADPAKFQFLTKGLPPGWKRPIKKIHPNQ